MSEEKRMAGDYEIIHAMHIGDTEIVVGENPIAAEGHRYMCGFCESNILFTRYDDIMASDDYPEIIGIYGQRVARHAEKTRAELNTPDLLGLDNGPVTRLEDICVISLCTSISRKSLRVLDFMMFVFTICDTPLRCFRLRRGQT